MINFDSLPTNNPMAGVKPGTYFATIDKAEMKQPKDPQKPMYLSVQYTLTTKEGKGAGKLFDILTESDSDVVRYKIGRFITALELPLTGAFALKDLAKIIAGKKLILDVTTDTKSDKPRAVVDVFKGGIYYSLNQPPVEFADTLPQDNEIAASDAEDFIPNDGSPIEY